MFEFLGRGRAKEKVPEPTVQPVAEPSIEPPKSHNKQREMIRLALSGVLRRHGIPSQWLGCEVNPVALLGVPDGVMIQLVIHKWHDGLVQYAPALQSELMKEIHLFDKNFFEPESLLVWKFAPDCGNPNVKLPDPGYWTLAVGKQSVSPPLEEKAPIVKFDLPKSDLDEEKDDDSGFAPAMPRTQLQV